MAEPIDETSKHVVEKEIIPTEDVVIDIDPQDENFVAKKDDSLKSDLEKIAKEEKRVGKKRVRKNFERTVKIWRRKVEKYSFVYDYTLDNYNKSMGKFLLSTLIFNALLTMISLGNFGISDSTNTILVYIFKGGTTVLTAIATILVGVPTTQKYREKIRDYQKYYDTVQNFNADIISHVHLPPEIRDDKKFVLRKKDIFVKILQDAPNVSQEEYKKANEEYKKTVAEGGKKRRMRQSLMKMKLS